MTISVGSVKRIHGAICAKRMDLLEDVGSVEVNALMMEAAGVQLQRVTAIMNLALSEGREFLGFAQRKNWVRKGRMRHVLVRSHALAKVGPAVHEPARVRLAEPAVGLGA